MLPHIHGSFQVVKEPEIRFNDSGKGWAKLRCRAADRTRDSNGTWTDSDPIFIDVIVFQGAENLIEVVNKGDSVVVSGRLRMREWEKDGVKQTTYSITADEIGPATRWKSTPKPDSPAQDDTPPF